MLSAVSSSTIFAVHLLHLHVFSLTLRKMHCNIQFQCKDHLHKATTKVQAKTCYNGGLDYQRGIGRPESCRVGGAVLVRGGADHEPGLCAPAFSTVMDILGVDAGFALDLNNLTMYLRRK